MSTNFNIDFRAILDTILVVEQIKKVKKCLEPTCGVHFMGGNSAKYCPECRVERNLYLSHKSNIKTGKPHKSIFSPKDKKEGSWYGQVFFKTREK